jgi:hypothetical protein
LQAQPAVNALVELAPVGFITKFTLVLWQIHKFLSLTKAIAASPPGCSIANVTMLSTSSGVQAPGSSRTGSQNRATERGLLAWFYILDILDILLVLAF